MTKSSRFMPRAALVVAVVAVFVALAGILASPASAQELSPGCQTVNSPGYDTQSWAGYMPEPLAFAAGDVITASAGEPTSSVTPTTLTLYQGEPAIFGFVPTLVIATTSFPGTVQYVIPTSGSYQFWWAVQPIANATWTVSCVSASEAAAADINDLQSLVGGLLLESGVSNALQSKLNEVLAALATGDSAAACSSLQGISEPGQCADREEAHDRARTTANKCRERDPGTPRLLTRSRAAGVPPRPPLGPFAIFRCAVATPLRSAPRKNVGVRRTAFRAAY
jgi:hypothetical protein